MYDTLHWLCRHNEDYRNVTIDYAEFARWPAIYIVNELVDWPAIYTVNELVDCISHISDNVVEQVARSGPATEEWDSLESELDFISISGLLDTNDILYFNNGTALQQLACLLDGDVIKVIHESNLMSSWDDAAYFTSAFPTLFSYDTGKHKDYRPTEHLLLKESASILLRHCSRF